MTGDNSAQIEAPVKEGHFYSAEFLAQLMQWKQEGVTDREIAIKLGVSRWSISALVRRQRQGAPSLRAADPEYDRQWVQRVKARCLIDDKGCWLWQGHKTPTGYGLTSYRTRTGGIHRYMYQIANGVPLQHEEYVLHRCDVRNCCNPDHLFIGTQKDNNNDCAQKGRHYEGSKTHCERGHPLSGDNVIIGRQHPPKTGIKRTCKACQEIHRNKPEEIIKRRERQRRYKLRKKAERLAQSQGEAA